MIGIEKIRLSMINSFKECNLFSKRNVSKDNGNKLDFNISPLDTNIKTYYTTTQGTRFETKIPTQKANNKLFSKIERKKDINCIDYNAHPISLDKMKSMKVNSNQSNIKSLGQSYDKSIIFLIFRG